MSNDSLRRWLRPGMHVKRWIALLFVGLTGLSLALAMAIRFIYDTWQVPEPLRDIVGIVTLQALPLAWRGAIVLALGLAIFGFAVWRLANAVMTPVLQQTAGDQSVATIIERHRFGPHQPEFNVVTIGGGTGLGYVLRGLKEADISLTAIVTVADDGGSTGRLRADYDIPAPGDIRNCLVSLAGNDSLMGELFNHRFMKEGSDLYGHSFGNLFITAMYQITDSFDDAIMESARVLDIRGRVLPSTLEYVTLCAHLTDGSTVKGESHIPHHNSEARQNGSTDDPVTIRDLYLEPASIEAHTPALAAIQNADLIVLGPGSLFTSVLPNLLVDGVAEAIRSARGTTVYVCNVATQEGETDGFSYDDHIREVVHYLGEGELDFALVNSNPAARLAIRADDDIDAVIWDNARSAHGARIIGRDVVNDQNALRHDPAKLAIALMELVRSQQVSRSIVPGGLQSPNGSVPSPSSSHSMVDR